jgi:hypothetical protein
MKGTNFGDVQHIRERATNIHNSIPQEYFQERLESGTREGKSALETNENCFDQNELSVL